MKNIFGVWFIAALFFTSVSIAQIRNVPSQYATIQAAINDCNDGDEVIISSGTYTGTGNRDIDFLGKAITVRGATGNPNDTIIDCNGGWFNSHRGFYFHTGEDSNSILDGLTIKNGSVDEGGGIFVENCSPTIRNCIVSNNMAEFNGAEGSHGGYGGGISCYNNANPLITNCTIISNNSNYAGAGIACDSNSSPTISNCTIKNNSGTLHGGGIFCEDNSNPLIFNCSITNNSITEYGAGIACFRSSPTVLNCEISGNSTGAYMGGGIGVEESKMIIKNCIIVGNYASISGGGIYCGGNDNPSNLSIINCTIANNHAGYNPNELGGGGGIACHYSNASLINSVLWGNTALLSGPQIALFLNPLWPSEVTVSYCDVQGGLANAYVSNGSTLDWQIGNIDVDPCFVNPAMVLTADFDFSGEVDFRDFAEFAAKWQSFEAGYKYDISIPADGIVNEIDLLVFANQWLSSADIAGSDYHLQSKGGQWDIETGQLVFGTANSRCIDAGMPGMSIGNETLVFEDNAFSGNLRINMGAYGGTAQASMGHYSNRTIWSRLCDATNDGIVDFSDFAVLANDFGLEDTENPLPADFDRDGHVGLSDIVKIAQDWLETTTWY